MKLKLTLIAALSLFTCPVTNCGVFSKFVGAAKNSFRSSFAKPAMLRLFDPKSIVLDDKYKDNPGVKVSSAMPKLFPLLISHAYGYSAFASDEESQQYKKALLWYKEIADRECVGPVKDECEKAQNYSWALIKARYHNTLLLDDAKKMAEEGFYEIFCTAMDHNDRNDQGLD